ncbi:STAS domain-containing protein [uncultured Tateyamaria sp.]|uniref:STAS domain-containing protein n=1 Tax=uncultured Tateyamaria sp. TaxID=455651 RepID=UPI0026343CBF|nr:STAS domain-containing protein [uncultured Tateyamaria sp.]
MVQLAVHVMADPIPLPKRLDTASAPDLLSQLVAHPPGSDVLLDAQNTSHIGALGAQVLLSARRRAVENNTSFCVLHVQNAVHDQLSAMGLMELTQQEEDK